MAPETRRNPRYPSPENTRWFTTRAEDIPSDSKRYKRKHGCQVVCDTWGIYRKCSRGMLFHTAKATLTTKDFYNLGRNRRCQRLHSETRKDTTPEPDGCRVWRSIVAEATAAEFLKYYITTDRLLAYSLLRGSVAESRKLGYCYSRDAYRYFRICSSYEGASGRTSSGYHIFGRNQIYLPGTYPLLRILHDR